MSQILVVNYGYNNGHSENANAICLYNIIVNDPKNHYIIVTDIGGHKIKQDCKNAEIISLSSGLNHAESRDVFKKDVMGFCEKIILEKSISNLLIVSFPIFCAKIGYKLKKKFSHLNFLFYQLDSYSVNASLRLKNVLFPIRYFWDYIIFRYADKILLTHEIYGKYQRNFLFKSFFHKMISIGIPIMNITKFNYRDNNRDCIRVVYIGSLNLQFRDPNPYLRLLYNHIKDIKNFELIFYGHNNDVIDNLNLSQYGKKMVLKSFVKPNDLSEVIRNADFLLNICNESLDILPSKILEYIGYRKPIINFTPNNKNIGVKYLADFPLKFNFYQNKNNEGFKDFVLNNRNNLAPYEIVEKNYHSLTTKFIVDNISKIYK